MNIKQKITAGVAAAGVMATILAPVSHAADVTISGNGIGSTNTVLGISVNKTLVSQSNTTVAKTKVVSSANTGNNKASGNTKGSVSQTTGKATSTVVVSVSGGSNTANLPDCGCPDVDHSVTIKNNGAFSKNTVIGKNIDITAVEQDNVTFAHTVVVSSANTGGNTANWNTGGTTTQSTGNANSSVGVVVTGGDNELN